MHRLLAFGAAALLTACASTQQKVHEPRPEPVRSTTSQTPAAAVARLAELERGRVRADEVTPYLGHEDAAVRARAALALARIGDPQGGTALIAVLGDPAPDVRALAAFALGALDDELLMLAEQIHAGHKGAEAWVREAAEARAGAEKALNARLHIESTPRVRRALYDALGQLVIGPGIHHIYSGLRRADSDAGPASVAIGVHAARRGQMAHVNDEIIAELIELGRHADSDVRFGAVFALARYKRPEAEALFSERLTSDSDVRVRTWAARGLGECPGAGAALSTGLSDLDWRVRVESLRALQKRSQRGVAPDRAAVRGAAERAIDELRVGGGSPDLSPAHVLVATTLLLDKEEDLAALEARLLSKVGEGARSPRRLGPLFCALAVARAARSMQMGGLATCSGPRVEPLELAQREVRALTWAARERPAEVARLHPYLSHEDSRVRVAAVVGISGAEDAASRELLRQGLAQETDAAVVEAVADAVATWQADTGLVKELEAALKRTEGSRESSVRSARAALATAIAVHGEDRASPLLKQLAADPVVEVRNALRRQLGEKPSYGVAPEFGPRPSLDAAGLAASIRTVRGTMVVDLLADEAPETVANFVRLARSGYYDGVAFHRVVPGFVVQAGDPRGDGFGGPGYVIPCEVTPRAYRRGIVGMALAGKDTGGSQFFIAQSRQPHLDGHYTAFGELVEGEKVLDSLLPGDAILRIEIGPSESGG